MSRLDQHVSAVRTRMAFTVWLRALAWALLVYSVVVWAAILIDRLVQLRLPHQLIWFWIGLGVTFAISIAYAIWRRPSDKQVAVAIDEKLLLKEKFSTALYFRPSPDPFAMAAVSDAEATADKVNLQRKFPVQIPKAGLGTLGAFIVVFLTAWLVPTLDLFGIEQSRVAQSEAAKQNDKQARDAIRRAIADIDSAPKAVAERPDIQLAKRDLLAMRGKPTLDPEAAKGTAQKAVESVQKAIKEKIDENQKFAVTQQDLKEFKGIEPASDETGPMADAQRSLAAGKLDQAVEDLSKAVNNFDKMDKKQQQKAADQTKKMATALQKMANDPNVQKQVQKQMQNMGANQQQIKQMQNLMQQAANGNAQAQQQINQMAKQLAQQMNQNGKASPQQQRQNAQQVQNALQQLQSKVNTQVNAQQLAQSAQALAQAMQQSAQGGQPGQAKQGGQAQMANKGQPGQQQGNKPGQQQGNGQQQQQMANAAKQMQQQLQQMQAVANDQQQVAAGQQQNGGGQDGNQPGQGGQQGQQGNGQGNQPGGKNQGWGQGNMPQNGPAQGQGPGMAGAGNNRPAPSEAPFATKTETDSLQKDEKGKVLASTFVKDHSIRGDAKMQLHDVLPPVDKNAVDEVGEQRIPRQDQDVVRGYFGDIRQDTQTPGK
ncbi:MAG TPA: hypothetical protein VLJ39_10905 [Tepidisphaeraceae bacterium]|nr:hypothetical protein [Tepidisphaeraceae bacterium]